MKIQFDGEVDDIPELKADLATKGHKVMDIHTSHWIGYDSNGLSFDQGGRIDIEVSGDHQLPEKRPALVALEEEIKINSKVKKRKKNGA